MKYIKKAKCSIVIVLFLILTIPMFAFFASCKKSTSESIKVFMSDTEQIETMPLETYIEGVVAAEIENDAPIEALKAQAVLARTFAVKYISEGNCPHKGADISTDIKEAQAYDPSRVYSNIKEAVKQTKGIVVKYDGELINAYFHANSGGKTTTSRNGLNTEEDYPYLKVVSTGETEINTKNYNFSATFKKDEILSALRNMGVSVSSASNIQKGELDESGRCKTLFVGGKEVDANTLRLNLGSTKLKSTLIESIKDTGSEVVFTGRGYGHGVGLSQEAASFMAEGGKDYRQIISFFFDGIEFSTKL